MFGINCVVCRISLGLESQTVIIPGNGAWGCSEFPDTRQCQAGANLIRSAFIGEWSGLLWRFLSPFKALSRCACLFVAPLWPPLRISCQHSLSVAASCTSLASFCWEAVAQAGCLLPMDTHMTPLPVNSDVPALSCCSILALLAGPTSTPRPPTRVRVRHLILSHPTREDCHVLPRISPPLWSPVDPGGC